MHTEGLQSSYKRLEAWEARLQEAEASAQQRAHIVTAKVHSPVDCKHAT